MRPHGCCRRMLLGISCILGLLLSAALDAAEPKDQPVTPEQTSQSHRPLQASDEYPVAPGGIEGRGIQRGPTGKKVIPPSNPSPPPNLCHEVTQMLTQCKCFNHADCQPLTALFPNSCPAGSQHCEFVPLSRGPMPPLPPNLCGYQVPLTLTECACRNAAECQLLSPFCSSTCPSGSQSCTCRPLRRG
jgi:hypothetical protein